MSKRLEFLTKKYEKFWNKYVYFIYKPCQYICKETGWLTETQVRLVEVCETHPFHSETYGTAKLYSIASISSGISNYIEFDPTPKHKYLDWILNRVTSCYILNEDLYKLTKYLEVFEKACKKNLIKEKDIYKYQDEKELFTAIEPFWESEQILFNKEIYERCLIHTSESWSVYIPKTFRDSEVLGSGTNWCTAKQQHYFDSYTRRDELIIFVRKDNTKEKYQIHFADGVFMDKNDRSYSFKDFVENNPDLNSFFVKRLSSHIEQLTLKGGSYDSSNTWRFDLPKFYKVIENTLSVKLYRQYILYAMKNFVKDNSTLIFDYTSGDLHIPIKTVNSLFINTDEITSLGSVTKVRDVLSFKNNRTIKSLGNLKTAGEVQLNELVKDTGNLLFVKKSISVQNEEQERLFRRYFSRKKIQRGYYFASRESRQTGYTEAYRGQVSDALSYFESSFSEALSRYMGGNLLEANTRYEEQRRRAEQALWTGTNENNIPLVTSVTSTMTTASTPLTQEQTLREVAGLPEHYSTNKRATCLPESSYRNMIMSGEDIFRPHYLGNFIDWASENATDEIVLDRYGLETYVRLPRPADYVQMDLSQAGLQIRPPERGSAYVRGISA